MLLKKGFKEVEIYGLFRTIKPSIYLRLKKGGYLKYDLGGKNLVKRFYDNITTSGFKISKNKLEKVIDFIAVCRNNH